MIGISVPYRCPLSLLNPQLAKARFRIKRQRPQEGMVACPIG